VRRSLAAPYFDKKILPNLRTIPMSFIEILRAHAGNTIRLNSSNGSIEGPLVIEADYISVT
jgi:hypothetical protein